MAGPSARRWAKGNLARRCRVPDGDCRIGLPAGGGGNGSGEHPPAGLSALTETKDLPSASCCYCFSLCCSPNAPAWQPRWLCPCSVQLRAGGNHVMVPCQQNGALERVCWQRNSHTPGSVHARGCCLKQRQPLISLIKNAAWWLTDPPMWLAQVCPRGGEQVSIV